MNDEPFQAAFALSCLGAAAAFAARWRRQVRTRTGGPRTASELYVPVNAVGSAALGAALLWQPSVHAVEAVQRWQVELRLARLPLRCDRGAIELRNDTGAPRRLALSDVAFESSEGKLLEAPQVWPTATPPADALVATGASLRLAVVAPAAGPCGPPPGLFAPQVLLPPPRCTALRAHLRSEADGAVELDLPVRCLLP
jgi:hypothetical protein